MLIIMQVDSQLECLLPGPFEGESVNKNYLFAGSFQNAWFLGLLPEFYLHWHVFLADYALVKQLQFAQYWVDDNYAVPLLHNSDAFLLINLRLFLRVEAFLLFL